MRLAPLLKGILTFIPGSERVLPKTLASRNPPSAYYYGVWLKHLVYLRAGGLNDNPQVVAELGPGDSLGLGIAALLSGTRCYLALDVLAHADTASNLESLRVIAELMNARAARPNRGWPDFDAYLDSRLFPGDILTEERLAESLQPARIDAIRHALQGQSGGDIEIAYRAPWNDAGVIRANTVDLVISQAVLEHVEDVPGTYAALYRWLKPGGLMSHQIDFDSHNITREFNGYRAVPEPVWRLAKGRRPYFINREPCSAHLKAMEQAGFEIISVQQHLREDGIPRRRLASRWKDISDSDLKCSGAFVQARKPGDRL